MGCDKHELLRDRMGQKNMSLDKPDILGPVFATF